MSSRNTDLRSFIKDCAAAALKISGVVTHKLSKPDRWLIITFHRVLPEEYRSQYPLPNLVVTPNELSWIIQTLRPFFDFHTVSKAQQLFQENSGRKANNRPILSLTFDDGQWDNFEYARPVLHKESVRATFYLPTDYIGSNDLLWHDKVGFIWEKSVSRRDTGDLLKKASDLISQEVEANDAKAFVNILKKVSPETRESCIKSLSEQYAPETEGTANWSRMMTWDEAKQLSQSGHEIGSHGMSHQSLDQLSSSLQTRELAFSAEKLEEKLGVEIKSMCYPNGDYNLETLSCLKTEVYANAVTTSWGINDSMTSNFELLRCDMHPFSMLDRHGNYSEERLLMRLAGFLRK